MADNTFNVLSICSGVGGLELGIKLAVPEARTICYVEGEVYACAVLAQRMQENALDSAPVWTNLRTFDGKPWRGKVDCIAGGYPCQPFSFAGKRHGADDPRHLWPVVAALVSDIRPPVCFFENVRGHISLGFRDVASDLQRMGYQVKAGLFSAAEVGAPHKRERLFILAYRNSDGRSNRCDNGKIGALYDETERNFVPPQQERLGAESGLIAHGADVADNSCECLQRSERTGSRGRESEKAVCERSRNLGAFPPSPDDASGWANVGADLEPAILRMADGAANRMDRIRACGNGVVPLVAAHAWRTLTAGLELKWNKNANTETNFS